MINFDFLEANKDDLRLKYLTAKPFPFLHIENICDSEKLEKLYKMIPNLDNKSRDYMFAGNKFEKSNYQTLGPLFLELQEDLRSERMNKFLSHLTGKNTLCRP